MALKARFQPYTLHFKETAITSRQHMDEKDTYILHLWDDASPEVVGKGECNLFAGLSAEDAPDYSNILQNACDNPDIPLPRLSSIRFGFESARWSLEAKGSQKMIDTPFSRGEEAITINGLVWMGDKRTMLHRMREKIDSGFRCVKLKIGGIDFQEELSILDTLRMEFTVEDIELRLDANGAFSPENAMERLERLSRYNIHSIEQPIRAGQWQEMARLCECSPIPIALDEELIGFSSDASKETLLDTVRPQYIILKPAPCGGFAESDCWISMAQKRNIGWWATSALESNIGLNAIAQWVARYRPTIPQGLGTGLLYTDNFPSILRLDGDKMWFGLIHENNWE